MNNRLFHSFEARHELGNGVVVQTSAQPCCEREET